MPRNLRRQDPFARINNWDDGYEYIRDKPPSPLDVRDPPPGARPAPYPYESDRDRRKPAREDEDQYMRRAYPSPPDSDEYPRRRQPPPYRSARSPSPLRRSRRDPPAATTTRPRAHRAASLESRSPPPIARSKSMRDPPRAYSRSPSPRRHTRRRSPSPILPGGRLHRDLNRDRRRDISPATTESIPRRRHPTRQYSTSPPPRPTPRTAPRADPKDTKPARPNLSRSKTTSAKDRFAGLSPRWQQAAAAAFQAGSMAAWNMRSQPGGWNGEKGARVATAALGAAAMNAFSSKTDKAESGRDKGKGKGTKSSRKNSGVEALGGALGGFLADQFTKKDKKRY